MKATPISTALALVLGGTAIAAWPAAAQMPQQESGQAAEQQTQDQQQGQTAPQSQGQPVQQVKQALEEATQALQTDDTKKAQQSLQDAEQSLQQAMQQAPQDQKQKLDQVQQSLNEADQALDQNDTEAAQTALQNAQDSLQQLQTTQGQQDGAEAEVIVTGEEEADVTIIRPDDEEADIRLDEGAGEAELGAAATPEPAAGALSQRRAEEVIGQSLVNAAGEEIGEIEDLVLDNDQVVYAVVGVGGFLGIGERKVAIPFDQIQLSEDEASIMTLMTEEDLEALPEYDPEQYAPMEREQVIGG